MKKSIALFVILVTCLVLLFCNVAFTEETEVLKSDDTNVILEEENVKDEFYFVEGGYLITEFSNENLYTITVHPILFISLSKIFKKR